MLGDILHILFRMWRSSVQRILRISVVFKTMLKAIRNTLCIKLPPVYNNPANFRQDIYVIDTRPPGFNVFENTKQQPPTKSSLHSRNNTHVKRLELTCIVRNRSIWLSSGAVSFFHVQCNCQEPVKFSSCFRTDIPVQTFQPIIKNDSCNTFLWVTLVFNAKFMSVLSLKWPRAFRLSDHHQWELFDPYGVTAHTSNVMHVIFFCVPPLVLHRSFSSGAVGSVVSSMGGPV